MNEDIRTQLIPGTKIRVTQQIAGPNYTLPTEIQGTIVSYDQRPTGSWYAHGKNDRLWLDRLVLKLADGEITSLNLDEYSHMEVIS